MNREYEALVIFKPPATDAELAQAIKQLEELIRKLGGQLDRSADWGRRRFTFRIARHSEGQYYLLHFRVAPNRLDELKRLFRLNEAIVRFLILNRSDQASVPASPHPAQEVAPARHA